MAEYDHRHKGFLTINEAAVQYEVSRAKVHRLIRAGQLHTREDPRDRRVTLLSQDELDTLFDISEDMARDDMTYETTNATGRLTAEMRERVGRNARPHGRPRRRPRHRQRGDHPGRARAPQR